MTWFDEIKKMRDEMINEIKKMFEDPLLDQDYAEVFKSSQPLVYGYSIYIGPDGIPVIKEYGNFKPNQRPTVKKLGRFEPYIDTIIDKEKKTFTLTAEIPGVDKKDISISVADGKVKIKSTTKGREFEKEIPLEAQIDPESIKASYKNGILEISAKIKEETDNEFTVKIE
ncbi:MAG: archaeal heat shock protein Hsp20 [Candidatus Odinarchaeia archaeon]